MEAQATYQVYVHDSYYLLFILSYFVISSLPFVLLPVLLLLIT